MSALALLLLLASATPRDPVPVWRGETSREVVDGADVWIWSAEHCGEVFALGEADTAAEASHELQRAIDAHARRAGNMQCDADADVAHPFAE